MHTAKAALLHELYEVKLNVLRVGVGQKPQTIVLSVTVFLNLGVPYRSKCWTVEILHFKIYAELSTRFYAHLTELISTG